MTLSVTLVVRCSALLVPMIVSRNVPLVGLVLTVIVVEPLPVTLAGLKVALAPLGKPLTLNVTVLLNPGVGVTVTM